MASSMLLPTSDTLRALIDFYYRSNYGTYTERVEGPDYDLAFSANVSDSYFNHALLKHGDPLATLQALSPEFAQRERTPALYITPLHSAHNAPLEEGLQTQATDSWMILDKARFAEALAHKSESCTLDIKEIDRADEESYIDTFRRAYSHPGDVYGPLPEGYCTIERRFFDSPPDLESRVFLTRQDDGMPIGSVRVVSDERYSLIYALGVDKPHRQGGRTAIEIGAFVIKEIIKRHPNNSILIMTEADTALERLYRKVGFKRLFTGAVVTAL